MQPSFWADKIVLITGGYGFLGSHIVDNLTSQRNVARENIRRFHSKENDLRKWENCVKAVDGVDIVIHLAGRVGGIGFNKENPATLFYDNAIIGLQLMEAARRQGLKKFVALGTVCAYPKYTPVPFKEEALWNGYPEETNAPYGIAKKMMLVQAQSYRKQYQFNAIYLLPANLYGPRDNFDLSSSHVIPAMIQKIHKAKTRDENSVTLWGTGNASREFLYVEDAAEAIALAAEHYNDAEPVNVGTGEEIMIKDLAKLIAELIEYNGQIEWDSTKPDGQPRRRLDIGRATRFGFRARITLREGLRKTIDWYLDNQHLI